jgi:hypothetical protein
MQAADRIEIAVGECKDAGGKIELDDVLNMAAVADSFPRNVFESYIIFSKTGPFTPEEVENCRKAQPRDGGCRVIMLSNRELEPYFLYEKASRQFDVRESVASLQDMALATVHIYFSPRLKVL